MLVLLFLYFITTKQHHSSVAPLSSFYQNHWPGWWENAWNNYSEARFKKTFRISRSTFTYILNRIGPFFAKETVAEDPVSPELRLSLCLYRLGTSNKYILCSLGTRNKIAHGNYVKTTGIVGKKLLI